MRIQDDSYFKDDMNFQCRLISSSTGVEVTISMKQGKWHEEWSQDDVYSSLVEEAYELVQLWSDQKSQEAWINGTFKLVAST